MTDSRSANPSLSERARILVYYWIGAAICKVANIGREGVLWKWLYTPYNWFMGRSAELDDYDWKWKTEPLSNERHIPYAG